MDIFISYRRQGGGAWASLINKKLSDLGIKAFYDKKKIENEDFEKKIKRSLEKSPNFLIILSPGIFAFTEKEGKDWVLEELRYAIECKKNIIPVRIDDFNERKDLKFKDPIIDTLKKINMLKYSDDSYTKEEASITEIVKKMVDSKGRQFTLGEQITENSWYAKYGMTEEDELWIKTDYDVCHKWDQAMLKKVCNEPLMKKKESISLFVMKAYDIETYRKKYDIVDSDGNPLIDNIYGTTYESQIDLANELFGEGHFLVDKSQDKIISEAKEILKKNRLKGYDIIDMTLVIKDMENPEKIVREMGRLLNPDGGVLFIRELDDDFVLAYPQEDLIKKVVALLELDPGAGNRHTGKKIYSFLKSAGADKVYISDEIISTANHKSKYCEQIFQTYFSYLRPELRNLAKEDPDTYKEAYKWFDSHYDKLENLFCSQEFYFRAGYISGYGLFEGEDE